MSGPNYPSFAVNASEASNDEIFASNDADSKSAYERYHGIRATEKTGFLADDSSNHEEPTIAKLGTRKERDARMRSYRQSITTAPSWFTNVDNTQWKNAPDDTDNGVSKKGVYSTSYVGKGNQNIEPMFQPRAIIPYRVPSQYKLQFEIPPPMYSWPDEDTASLNHFSTKYPDGPSKFYECPYCDKRLDWADNLQGHVEAKHPEKAFVDGGWKNDQRNTRPGVLGESTYRNNSPIPTLVLLLEAANTTTGADNDSKRGSNSHEGEEASETREIHRTSEPLNSPNMVAGNSSIEFAIEDSTHLLSHSQHNEDSKGRHQRQEHRESRGHLDRGSTTLEGSTMSQLSEENRQHLDVKPEPMASQCNALRSENLPFYFDTLPSLVDYIFGQFSFLVSEPPIPDGKVRARWKCACGMTLFDDFTELHQGSIERLENDIHRQQPPSKCRARQGVVYQTAQAVQYGTLVILDGLRRLLHNLDPRLLTRHSNPGSSLPFTTETQPNQVGGNSQSSLRALLCIDKGATLTTLCQEQLNAISTDRQLLSFLKAKHSENKSTKSWLTLRSLKSACLTRFAVDHSKYADTHSHNSVCLADCVCLPPISMVGKEYECGPAPRDRLPGLSPAIGPNYLTHCLLHPEMIDGTQKSLLLQIPKLVNGPLATTSSKYTIGWGLHFREGWHLRTIWCFLVFIVTASLLFGIVWSVVRDDVQGGFGISSYLITMGALGVGYLAIREG